MATASPTAPPPVATERRRRPLTIAALDSAIARSAAGFGIVLVPQVLPGVGAQLSNMAGWWVWSMVPLLLGTLLFATLAAFVRRLIRVAHGGFALAYFLTLASWPFAVIDPHKVPAASIFIAGHLIIACACAIVSVGPFAALPFIGLLGIMFGWLRASAAGGGIDPVDAAVEAAYGVLLSVVIAVVIALLRRAVADVFEAQRAAMQHYATAVMQHATDVERLQVDAIVHDSVLTTLLSAARASTPDEQALAATMAGNAIDHLRSAALAPDDGESVGVGVLASRLTASAEELMSGQPGMSTTIEVRGHWSLPIATAEAITAAATQALVNSLQHAGPANRQILVRDWPSDRRVAIVIADDGRGFDTERALATGRLGLRVSIVERMELVGGAATILSEPGTGTTIVLDWPARHPGAAGERITAERNGPRS